MLLKNNDNTNWTEKNKIQSKYENNQSLDEAFEILYN